MNQSTAPGQVHTTEQRAGALLQDVAALSARADASEKAIKDGAAARLKAIDKRQEELRPTVLTSADDCQEYQALSIERHRLTLVVMQS